MVASVGAVNATALMMIVPAPLLWLLIAGAERQITWRRAGSTAARIGVLSLGVSLWWMAMVIIQGRLGADVLAYSESLEAVSFTSTSHGGVARSGLLVDVHPRPLRRDHHRRG